MYHQKIYKDGSISQSYKSNDIRRVNAIIVTDGLSDSLDLLVVDQGGKMMLPSSYRTIIIDAVPSSATLTRENGDKLSAGDKVIPGETLTLTKTSTSELTYNLTGAIFADTSKSSMTLSASGSSTYIIVGDQGIAFSLSDGGAADGAEGGLAFGANWSMTPSFGQAGSATIAATLNNGDLPTTLHVTVVNQPSNTIPNSQLTATRSAVQQITVATGVGTPVGSYTIRIETADGKAYATKTLTVAKANYTTAQAAIADLAAPGAGTLDTTITNANMSKATVRWYDANGSVVTSGVIGTDYYAVITLTADANHKFDTAANAYNGVNVTGATVDTATVSADGTTLTIKTNKYGSVTAQDINKVYVKGVPSTLKRDQSLAALASTVAIDTTYGTANYTLGNITWQKNSSNTSDTTVSGGTYTMIINVKPNAGFKFASGFAYTDVTTDGANATSGAAAVAADGSYNVSIQFSTIAPNDAEKLAAAEVELETALAGFTRSGNTFTANTEKVMSNDNDTLAAIPTTFTAGAAYDTNVSTDGIVLNTTLTDGSLTVLDGSDTAVADGHIAFSGGNIQLTKKVTATITTAKNLAVDVTIKSGTETNTFTIVVPVKGA